VDEAIAAYHKAIELDPKNAPAHYNLGITLRAQGKVDEAIAAYRKAIEIDPIYFDAHANLAHTLQVDGRSDEAIASYRKAVELDPKSVWARNALSNALAEKSWDLANNPDPRLRDPKRAVEACQEAVEVGPQSVTAWQYLGWVLYRAGNWKASIEALEKSCKLQEGGTGDCCQWIVMALANGKLANEKDLPEQERTQHKAAARRWYDEAVKQINTWGPGGNPIVQATRAFRAEAAEFLGVNQALMSLEMLVAAQPDAWEPRVNLAQAYANEGLWEKAATESTKATEVKPDAWEPWSARAFFHFGRQQWDSAIGDFSKAIDLAPQVHTNWWHRGHAWLQLAQWDKAAADFGYVVEQWPEGGEGWYLRAVAFAQLKQPDKALADLRQAIAKDFRYVDWIKTDFKLDPLRARKDFGELLRELEQKAKSEGK
jgi:superkiller protein 3